MPYTGKLLCNTEIPDFRSQIFTPSTSPSDTMYVVEERSKKLDKKQQHVNYQQSERGVGERGV